MTATWKTSVTSTQSIRYGTSTGVYIQTVAATQYSYADFSTGGDVCCMQVAQATGLTPNTTYYYQVGGDVAGWSTEHGFNTLLSKGVSSTFTFVAFGDQGADDTGGSRRPLAVSASVEQDNPDLILMSGDIFYCDDQACVDTYFDDIMGNNLSSSYFMTAPGNHEFYQPDDLVTYTSRLVDRNL